jgi:hypothetical protein
MASPLIDPDMLAALQQFMPQQAPDTDEQKWHKQQQGLLGFSAAALANMYGPTGVGLGRGLAGGLAAYNEADQQQRRDQLAQSANLRSAIESYGALRNIQKDMGKKKVINDFYAAKNAPGAPATQPSPDALPVGPPAPDGSLPPAVNPAAPPVPSVVPPAPTGPAPAPLDAYGLKKQRSDELNALGDAFTKANDGETAKQYYDAAAAMLPKFKEDKSYIDASGKRVVVRIYDDGTQQILKDVAPDRKLHFQDTGGGWQGVDEATGQPVPGASGVKTQGPDSKASNAVAWARLNEEQRHNQQTEGSDEDIESMAQLIADGKMAPPTGFAAARPAALKMMALVAEINPQYSAIDYNTAKATDTAFTKGVQGNSVRSINAAVDHLEALGHFGDALENKNTPAINKIGNFIATQTGGAAPTTFNAAKQVVAAEIVKAIAGSGGALSDREELSKQLKDASSPAQLKGAIAAYQQLMTGQLNALRKQYEAGTKKKDFNDRFLSEGAKRIMGGSPPTTSDLQTQADAIIGAK